MADKQIIINNIDVSECEHLTETRHCKAQMAVMGTDANKCKCFPNCYYKQLKRAEQKLAYIKEYFKPKVMMNGTANVILQIIENKANE